jgi:hypothetical protein
MLERRASLWSGHHFAGSSLERQTLSWKNMAELLLKILYTFQGALTAIKQGYFNGCEVLFPDFAQSLADLLKYAEEQAVEFNIEFAGEVPNQIDLEALKRNAGKCVPRDVTNLVDLAKADALDDMGENKASLALMERHL